MCWDWRGGREYRSRAESESLGQCMDIEPQIKYQGDFMKIIIIIKPLWGEAPAVWLQPQPVLTNTRYKSTTKSFPLVSFPKRSKSRFSQYQNYGARETVLWSSTYWTRKRTWAWISGTHWEPDLVAHICNPSFPTGRCEAEPGETLRWVRLAYAVARRGLRQDERQVPTLKLSPDLIADTCSPHHRTTV